jgi:hypothetical protein
MDRTPRPFDTAVLLNHARQSRVGLRKSNKSRFGSNTLSKPLSSTPPNIALLSGTIAQSRDTKIASSGSNPDLAIACSKCGDPAPIVPPSDRKSNAICSRCHSRIRSEVQSAVDPTAIARSPSGTSPSAGDCNGSHTTPTYLSTPQASRHSWISLLNSTSSPPTSTSDSHSASTTIVDEDDATALLRRPPAVIEANMDPSSSSDTLDLAFFLRTTGPAPQSKADVQTEEKRLRKLIALSKFRKRSAPAVMEPRRVQPPSSIYPH